ncbi:MAG: hypothetical protein ABI295_02460 [Xanthomarina sp.]
MNQLVKIKKFNNRFKILEIMKKIFSLTAIIIFSITLNANTVNSKGTVNNEFELLMPKKQSCFSFYHGLFNDYYGGINLGNVGDFNHLVAQCQSLFGY